jgi:quercetin dioxygenase-like cupin family protein
MNIDCTEHPMTKHDIDRRTFHLGTMTALLAATVAAHASAADAQAGAGSKSTRRDVIKQRLPGEPAREISLVEVMYPPGTGSPAHAHAHGVMAYVVSGAIASQVGEGPEQTFRAGESWWEPEGAVHRVSRNASTTEPATLLAIYIAPAGASGADLMKPL